MYTSAWEFTENINRNVSHAFGVPVSLSKKRKGFQSYESSLVDKIAIFKLCMIEMK